MTIVGTCHFPSIAKARRYYRAYSAGAVDVESMVQRKFAEGEIKLGSPQLKPGDRLILIDQGTRYGIVTPD